MRDLPEELQHLRNLIDAARANHRINTLRNIIKNAADEAPAADVIRMAEMIFQRGAEMSRLGRN